MEVFPKIFMGFSLLIAQICLYTLPEKTIEILYLAASLEKAE